VRLGTDTGVGLVMVVAAAISRGTKRLLRISDETVDDPWYRRHDPSGLSSARRSSSHLPDGLGRSDLAAKNVFDSSLLRQT
jgi:hypothetical protein